MPVTGGGRNTFSETGELALNTNSENATSEELDIKRGATTITFYVLDDTGNHSNHVVKLQLSPNGTDFVTAGGTSVTGQGFAKREGIHADSVRLIVTTAEGSASTSKVFIFAS